MLEPETAHVYENLIEAIYRLRLARPALYALAERSLRRPELEVRLVGATGTAVHYRTLARALGFLRRTGLITRHDRSPRAVVFAITLFGQTVVTSMQATERIAREGQHHARQAATPAGPAGPVVDPGSGSASE